jgi:general stress protein 26
MADRRAEHVSHLADLLEPYRVCMLVTRDNSQGILRARPMAMQRERFDGTLWFFTDVRTHKVDEVEAARDVCVTLSDPDEKKSASISGKAYVSQDRDRMRELWSEDNRAWFPDGPDGEHVALLRVEAEAAEYWDSPGTVVTHALGFAKAVVTGQPYDGEGGLNEKLDL